MKKIFAATSCFLKAKLRQRRLFAAELLSPSLIMLATFVLGWAISTTEKLQVSYFASSTHVLLDAEAVILGKAARRADIPACLAPLSRALEAELLRRAADLQVALRHHHMRQERDKRIAGEQRGRQVLQLQGGEQQQQQQQQQGGKQQQRAHSRPHKGHWRISWNALRNVDVQDFKRSPGELAGRELVMALLAAVRRPGVSESLEQCRWSEMLIGATPPTTFNIFNQLLGPTPLMTFDEWVLMSAALNASTAASGSNGPLEELLKFTVPVMPVAGMQPGWLALAPDTPQVRALAAHMSYTHQFFDDVFLGVYDSAAAAMEAAAVATGPAPSPAAAAATISNGSAENPRHGRPAPFVRPSRLWAVLEFATGPERGVGADYAIRMDGLVVPSTFGKYSPAECKTCTSDYIPYAMSGFLSLQAAVDGYILGLNRTDSLLSSDDNGGGAGRDGIGVGGGGDVGAFSLRSEATAWPPGLESQFDGLVAKAAHGGDGGAVNATAAATMAAAAGLFGIWFTPFPNMGQEVNAFYEYGSPLLGLLTACSAALPLAMAVRAMVSQRQSGMQHLLHVLGLSPYSWQAAWMLATLPVLTGGFALEGWLAASTYLRLVQPGLLATVMGATAAAAAAWAVMLGSAFGDAKLASTGSFMVTLFAGLPFLALYTSAPAQNLLAKRGCCLLWPTALAFLLQRMAAGHQLRRFGADPNGGSATHVSAAPAVVTLPGLSWSTATQGHLPTVELLSYLVVDVVLYYVAAVALEAWWSWRRRPRCNGDATASRHRQRGGGVKDGGSGGGGDESGAALVLSGLAHRYSWWQSRLTLSNVSISVSAGEAVALLGPNAAGKTTLVGIASGRLQPRGAGYVAVAGRLLAGAAARGAGGVRSPGGRGRGGLDGSGSGSGSQSDPYRDLGYCPQGNLLFPDLTAQEHLELALVLRRRSTNHDGQSRSVFGFRPKFPSRSRLGWRGWLPGLSCCGGWWLGGVSRRSSPVGFKGRDPEAVPFREAEGQGRSTSLLEAAEELAARVSLPREMMQVLSKELSGGSKRKLQLAMAMAGEPRVLLLDEVTAGVDAESRQAIWEALINAKRGPWGYCHLPSSLPSSDHRRLSDSSTTNSSDLDSRFGDWSGSGSISESGADTGPDSRSGASSADEEAGKQPATARRDRGAVGLVGGGQGAALLFTSHHLGEVAAVADRLVVLKQGRIQSEAAARSLRAALQGAHQVLRITTRPANDVATATAASTPAAGSCGPRVDDSPEAASCAALPTETRAGTAGSSSVQTASPYFTRLQLQDLVLQLLGPGPTHVLYSTLTSTGICVIRRSRSGGSGCADDAGSGGSAASLDRLVQHLQELSQIAHRHADAVRAALAVDRAGVSGSYGRDGCSPAIVIAAATASYDAAGLGGLGGAGGYDHPSGAAPVDDWESQPLAVVRCTVGPPSLEDILAMGLDALNSDSAHPPGVAANSDAGMAPATLRSAAPGTADGRGERPWSVGGAAKAMAAETEAFTAGAGVASTFPSSPPLSRGDWPPALPPETPQGSHPRLQSRAPGPTQPQPKEQRQQKQQHRHDARGHQVPREMRGTGAPGEGRSEVQHEAQFSDPHDLERPTHPSPSSSRSSRRGSRGHKSHTLSSSGAQRSSRVPRFSRCCGGGAASALANLRVSLPALLAKHRIQWLRDLPSLLRLLLLPLLAVALAATALLIKPSSSGPPAPLDLAWLGLQQPVPAAAVPDSWRHTMAGMRTRTASGTGEAAAMHEVGLVPLRPEWMGRAAADPASSLDVSRWFIKVNVAAIDRAVAAAAAATAAAASAEGGGGVGDDGSAEGAATTMVPPMPEYGAEPTPPLQAALVFDDIVNRASLARKFWRVFGSVVEDLVMPGELPLAGETRPETKLKEDFKLLMEEEGAIPKMFDFLYDRMLLHEFFSIARYVIAIARKTGGSRDADEDGPSAAGTAAGAASAKSTTAGTFRRTLLQLEGALQAAAATAALQEEAALAAAEADLEVPGHGAVAASQVSPGAASIGSTSIGAMTLREHTRAMVLGGVTEALLTEAYPGDEPWEEGEAEEEEVVTLGMGAPAAAATAAAALGNDTHSVSRALLASDGGVLGFFKLSRLISACNLTLPDTAGDERMAGGGPGRGRGRRGGGGSRTLLMSYRPPLHVALQLAAGLLPPKRSFCPIARILVEHAQAAARVSYGYVARRSLPSLTLLWNITSPHGLPATLNHLHNTMLRVQQRQRQQQQAAAEGDADGTAAAAAAAAGGGSPAAYGDALYGNAPIRVRNHPLPTRRASGSFSGLIDQMLLAVMVALPISYVTGGFVVRSCQEAASGAKQQQLAAGRCSPLSYWLSTWLSDLALFTALAAALVGLLLLARAGAFTGNVERCGGVAALLLAFGGAVLPWGYCIGLRCSSPAEAQGLVSNAGLVTGVALALARQVLSHVRRFSKLAELLLPLMRLFPTFCLADGLLQLSLLDVIRVLSEVFGRKAATRGFFRSIMEGHLVGIDPNNTSPFQRAVLGDNLSYLALDAVLYGSILLFLEWRASRGDLLPGWIRWMPIARLRLAVKSTVAKVAAAATVAHSSLCAVRCCHWRRRRSGGGGIPGNSAEKASFSGSGGEDGNGGGEDVDGGGGTRSWYCHRRRAVQFTAAARGADDDHGDGGQSGRFSFPQEPDDVEEGRVEVAGGAAAPPESCVVRVWDVYKVYGNGTAALRGLTFGLHPGECLALIGRNGAGKSTALAVLSGRLAPSSGRVTVGGVDVAGRPAAARSRVAMCPQTNPLLPLLTPAEHLALYAALYSSPPASSTTPPLTPVSPSSDHTAARPGGRRRSRRHRSTSAADSHRATAAAAIPAAPLLNSADVAWRCGLDRLVMDRPTGQLSGGSQRKISLAIALLGRPQLLLLDEPSTGMDPGARRGMCDAINMAVHGQHIGTEMGVQPPAVVLTTHYCDEALALCDVLGVMEAGRLLSYGTPEAALRNLPRWHYLADPEEWGEVLPALVAGTEKRARAGW